MMAFTNKMVGLRNRRACIKFKVASFEFKVASFENKISKNQSLWLGMRNRDHQVCQQEIDRIIIDEMW